MDNELRENLNVISAKIEVMETQLTELKKAYNNIIQLLDSSGSITKIINDDLIKEKALLVFQRYLEVRKKAKQAGIKGIQYRKISALGLIYAKCTTSPDRVNPPNIKCHFLKAWHTVVDIYHDDKIDAFKQLPSFIAICSKSNDKITPNELDCIILDDLANNATTAEYEELLEVFL